MVDNENNSGRNQLGQFTKGSAGGPGGSKRRAVSRRAIEEAVSPEYLQGLMRKMVQEGLKGNPRAADLVMKYTAGRPADPPQEPEPLDLQLPDLNSQEACSKATEVVVMAINAGKIRPDEGKVLLSGIKTRSQLLPTSSPDATTASGAAKRTIPSKIVRLQFERFARSGELPNDLDEAEQVVKQVKLGAYIPVAGADDEPTPNLGDGFVYRSRGKAPAMDALLDEAIYAPAEVRAFARCALLLLAALEQDVTGNPLHDRAMPEFGTVGMMLLSYPECTLRRPYIAQGRRVIARMKKLRQASPTDRKQHDEYSKRRREAATYFEHTGERPADNGVFEWVLAVHEMATLCRHADGEKVRDLLRLFDEIARTTGETRESAIVQLQAMAKAGRLLSPTSLAS